MVNRFQDLGALLLGIAAWFSSVLGLPPEARDAALLRCAPAQTLVYLEWAERAPGKVNAPGFEGLMADPEITGMFREVDESLRRVLTNMLEGSEEANEMAVAIPSLLRTALIRGGCVSLSFNPELVGPAVKRANEEGQGLPPERQAIAGIVGTIVLKPGDDADLTEKYLASVFRILTRGKVNVEKLDRTEVFVVLPGLKLFAHRHGPYLIVSTQPDAIDGTVAGLDGTDRGLAGQPRFKGAMEQIAIPRTGSALWIDTKGLMQVTSTSLGLPGILANGIVSMLGLERVETIASASGIEEGRVVSRNWLGVSGQMSKVLSIFAGQGIPPKRFQEVPGDADLVVGLSLDLKKVLDEAQRLGKAMNKTDGPLEFLRELEERFQKIGISWSKLTEPFADNAIVYDAPGSGGLFMSGLVGLIEVRDHERAVMMIDQVVRTIREQLPPFNDRSQGVALGEGDFLGEKVYYVQQVKRDPSMINPAFCLTKKSLIVGMHPQAVKAHLRLTNDANAVRFSARLKDAEGGFKIAKGQLLLFRYLNLKSLGRLTLPLLPYGGIQGTAQFQVSGLDIGALSVPSASAILPYLKDHFSGVVRTEAGILHEGEGSLPPAWIDTLLWLYPAFFVGVFQNLAMDLQQHEPSVIAENRDQNQSVEPERVLIGTP